MVKTGQKVQGLITPKLTWSRTPTLISLYQVSELLKDSKRTRGWEYFGCLETAVLPFSPFSVCALRQGSQPASRPGANISQHCKTLSHPDCLGSQVVRHPPREWQTWIWSMLSMWDFFGVSGVSGHSSDLNIGTPVATLPGTWCYRVSARTGWPGVGILSLGEIASLVCNFCLHMAACTLSWADLPLRYTSVLLGCLTTNKQLSHPLKHQPATLNERANASHTNTHWTQIQQCWGLSH